MKAIVGTHHYTDNNGHTYFGSIVGVSTCNLVWFLPLCDDGITWMKEPVCVAGVVANATALPPQQSGGRQQQSGGRQRQIVGNSELEDA